MTARRLKNRYRCICSLSSYFGARSVIRTPHETSYFKSLRKSRRRIKTLNMSRTRWSLKRRRGISNAHRNRSRKFSGYRRNRRKTKSIRNRAIMSRSKNSRPESNRRLLFRQRRTYQRHSRKSSIRRASYGQSRSSDASRHQRKRKS